MGSAGSQTHLGRRHRDASEQRWIFPHAADSELAFSHQQARWGDPNLPSCGQGAPKLLGNKHCPARGSGETQSSASLRSMPSHSPRSAPAAATPSQTPGSARAPSVPSQRCGSGSAPSHPHSASIPPAPHYHRGCLPVLGAPPSPHDTRRSLRTLRTPPSPHDPRDPSMCSGRLRSLTTRGGLPVLGTPPAPHDTRRSLHTLRTPPSPHTTPQLQTAPAPSPRLRSPTAPAPRPRDYKGGSAGAQPGVASQSPVSLCRHLRCPVRQPGWKRWCGAARSWPACPRRSCRRPGRRCCCTPSTARA